MRGVDTIAKCAMCDSVVSSAWGQYILKPQDLF